jgi:syntaxin-binding protein 5
MVRTLDEVDVHKVEPREPIFELAWSSYPNSYDARGGEAPLIVLGGQFAHDSPGVHVLWLPAFNPPAPPM